MNLVQKISQQRLAVEKFESALEDIQSPPKYPAPASEPLIYLQNLLATAESEGDRREKLAAAETALQHARAVLSDLETEQSAIDQATAAKSARSELEALAQQYNQLSDDLADAAVKLLEAEERLRPALSAHRSFVNPVGRELLNGLSVASIAPDGLKISPRSKPVWQRPFSQFA